MPFDWSTWIARGKQLYLRHRVFADPAVFLGGMLYDTLTITRIDRMVEHMILLLYLLLLGGALVIWGRWKLDRLKLPVVESYVQFLPLVVQFLMGGLFSVYVIFYFQSTPYSGSVLFLLFLVGLMLANEFLHDRLRNLTLLLVLYMFTWFSFGVFFVPVLLKRMGPAVFLGGATLGLFPVSLVVYLIYRRHLREHAGSLLIHGLAVGGVFLTLIGFYFLNLIPPVPLSMEAGGVYHGVKKAGDTYRLQYVEPAWYEFWAESEDPFLYRPGDRVYCFVSVFAPTELRMEVTHEWQVYRPGDDRWETTDEISYRIVGGRDRGYRGYTYKSYVRPGAWRVNVWTENQRLLGRVAFRVIPAGDRTLEFVTVRR